MTSPTSVVVLEEEDNETSKITLLSLNWSVLPASLQAQRTHNPIRAIVDPFLASLQNHDKSHISLALGDPSSYFSPCPVVVKAVQEHMLQSTGYVPAVGILPARQAIADYSNRNNPFLSTHVSVEDVIVANGCSGALELLFRAALQPPHDVLLIPAPGFPLYNVICESLGCHTQTYPLMYDHETEEWHMDLVALEALLLQPTNSFKAILINNPSNPTGAVFSKAHLQDFLKLCDKYQLMVISDEIYGDMTLRDDCEFHSLANVRNEMVPSSQVPIVVASGLGKQYLVPGWRVGWLVFHDNVYGTLQSIRHGTQQLSQVIMGASHLVQWAIPAALGSTGQDHATMVEWKHEWRLKLQEQAQVVERVLRRSPFLKVFRPQGAMYLMVRIVSPCKHGKKTDSEWTRELLQQENVLVLPGSCFGMKENDCFFRIVFGAPTAVLEEAGQRIVSFLERVCLNGTVNTTAQY